MGEYVAPVTQSPCLASLFVHAYMCMHVHVHVHVYVMVESVCLGGQGYNIIITQ